MNSAFIQDGTINNAKIGNEIKSNNYVAGSQGWKINKGGFAEFTSVVLNGGSQNGGTLTAGLVKSSDNKMIIDLANKSITITS